MKVQIHSLSGTSYPKWVSWMGVAAGVLMLVMAFYSRSYHYVIVGLGCLFAGVFRRSSYLCEDGAVRERCPIIGRKTSELFRWSQVEGVAFSVRKGKLVMSLSKGEGAWNLYFSPQQEREILDLLDKVRPDMKKRRNLA